MKKVFISHPYANDPIGNKEKVDKICRDLLEDDICIPVSPLHMFGYMDNDDHRRDVLEVCFRVISVCDEVWVYGDSNGCNKEVKIAKQLGKPVKNIRLIQEAAQKFNETVPVFFGEEARMKLGKALKGCFETMESDVFNWKRKI